MAGKASSHPPKLYTRVEAAQVLRRNVRSLDRLLALGQLQSVRIGRKRLIPEAALVEIIQRGTPPSVPESNLGA